MSQPELLARLAKFLNESGIPYMLTGSHASIVYGNTRTTHDIDVVVDMCADQIDHLAAAFSDEQFAFDAFAARQAIARNDMFQLDDIHGGDKIDFWLLQSAPFDRASFERRKLGAASGVPVYLPTVEDHLLQKLRWAHEFESERQFSDALLLYELHAGNLDMNYVLSWVDALNIRPTWEKLLAEAQPL